MEKRFIFLKRVLVLLILVAHTYCLSATSQPLPLQLIPQTTVMPNPIIATPAIVPAPTPVTPAAAPAAPIIVSDLQKKIDAAKAEPTVLKKISTCKDAITLVAQGTLLSEKEAIIQLVKGLVMTQANLVAQEFQALIDLCNLITKNTLILSAEQRVIMDQWIKTLTFALKLTTGTDTLMACLKKNLATPPAKDWNASNYSLFIQGAILAGNLLVSDPNNPNQLPKEESDINNQQGLLYKLKQAGYIILGNRAKINTTDLSAFFDFITLTKAHPELKDSIVPGWETILSIDIALNSTSKKNIQQQIKDFTTTLALFTKDTDLYEKGLYVSALATIFSNRKDRSTKELTEFKTLIDTILTSPTTKDVFDTTSQGQIKRWQTILQATLVFLGSYDKIDLKTKITTYQAIMGNIVGDETDYEKNLFFKGFLTDLFNSRGNLGSADLTSLKDFFATVQKNQGLLNAQQTGILNVWLQEMTEACRTISMNQVAGASGTYLAALITEATLASSIDFFNKCLGLISSSTNQSVKDAFIRGLNTLFNKRQNIDKKALLKFLKTIKNTKIGDINLLNSEQTGLLRQWLKTLKTEGVTA